MAAKHLWKTKLSYNGSAEIEEMGVLRTEFDSTDKCFKTYRFVKTATDTVVPIVGSCLAFYAGGTVVTGDISTTCQGLPAGVANNRIDRNSCGWLQVGGYNASVYLTTGGSEGTGVHLSATDLQGSAGVDGRACPYRPLGYMAYGCGSAAVILTCLDNLQP